ncbi:MAG: metallophosphoesterase [Actinobacteria bacterium]|nr:metallophosphoesterase [Actinomycetota bacterium]
MPTPSTPTSFAARIRRALTTLLALFVVLALAPPVAPAAAASSTLALDPGRTAWATLGGSRTSTLASVAVTVPSALPLAVGLQLRGSHSSGYRTTLAVAANGSVTGSIGRLDSGAETTLLPATGLGLRVAAGEKLWFQAAVVATSRVWVYLRAWSSSVAKPATWQLAVSDASAKRRTSAGRTYLWAESDTATRLAYSSSSVKTWSASKAAAIGVVPSEPGTDTFSIAVLPDTQNETSNSANTPFLGRVNWLVANRGTFDLRYVLHTGDMTNWGWLEPVQLTRAKAAMDVIARAGIPYSLTVGNHDTEAVGWSGHGTTYGGSAYQDNPECLIRLGAAACKSTLLLRHTEAFNQTFPVASIAGVGGVYENGKIDNNWTTFSANGTDWLVLTLELWPRTGVVDWARGVVAGHPDHNVIIQTHNYLTSKRTIEKGNGGYGATSPRYLYDQVIAKYPNVKLVFSGHTGGFGARVDTPNGHTVLAYLGNLLSGSNHNPVRLVSINTRSGDVVTTVFDPANNTLVSATSNTISIVR